MNIQPVSQQNPHFDGKVHTINLSKKQNKIVHQLRAFLNKQVEGKKYDLYISSWDNKPWSRETGLMVWAGKSAKHPHKNMLFTNDYFTSDILTSTVKQAITKYENFFGAENLVKGKSFWERLFG